MKLRSLLIASLSLLLLSMPVARAAFISKSNVELMDSQVAAGHAQLDLAT